MQLSADILPGHRLPPARVGDRRSALIREAVKVYLTMARRRGSRSRFLEMTESLRDAFAGRADDGLEELIDRAVDRAREKHGG